MFQGYMSRHQFITKDITTILLMSAVVNVSLLEKPLTYDFFARASNLVSLKLNDNCSILSYIAHIAHISEILYFRFTLTSDEVTITIDNALIRER